MSRVSQSLDTSVLALIMIIMIRWYNMMIIMRPPHQRFIIGGADASKNEFPWAAFLRKVQRDSLIFFFNLTN